jgi:formate--tetrahydrofolate ligase
VTAAHNLLAAALDASLFHGNPLGISPWSITWPRTLDVNDRALRKEIIGLGGRLEGVPRESEFVITAASEIMAILALAADLEDLRARLGRITVGEDGDGKQVTAEDLRVAGAMTVILKDAIRPNLVQTLEGQPVFIHAGPFGNIAHANNSIIADRVALKSADLVVTEAGFGSDLGFEKFCHIVCRSAGFAPSAALLVATVRALKAHGGVPESVAGTTDDREALKRGSENLAAHIDIVRAFGLPVVVGVNRFPNDSDADLELLTQLAVDYGADEVVMNDGFTRGGEGAEDLAAAVLRVVEKPNSYAPLNAPGSSIREQIETIATRVYGADRVEFAAAAERRLAGLAAQGLDTLPVCMAKTHLSLSHDPLLKGRPRGFVLPVRDVVPSTGAGFVVALCGEMMRMPGLGRDPAFTKIDVDATGRTVGMF